MQYILLVRQNERWNSMSEAERDRVHDASIAWHEELVRSGHSRGATCLSASPAATVWEAKGRVLVTDGPYAETREVLGGYEVIECADLDEAVAIAGRFPALRIGFAVEVRQIMPDEELPRPARRAAASADVGAV